MENLIYLKSNDTEADSNYTGNILKLCFIILIISVTLFFGFWTLFLKLNKKSTRFLGFFNSFSGGIFCGIGLFLLLPEGKEVCEDWAKKNISDEKLQDLPFCFFIAFLAYSFFLFIEKVLFSASSLIPMVRGEGHGHGHAHDTHEHEHHPEHSSPDTSEDEDEEAFKNVVSSKGKFASFLGMRNLKQSIAENKPVQQMDRALVRSSQILTRTFTRANEHNPDMDLLVNPIKSDIVQHTHEQFHNNEENEAKIIDTKLISNATPYLLLAALCLDGFFEGIALGIQSSWQNVLFVAGAIVINKIAVGFSLGISFKKSNTDIQTFIRFILLFSLFTPFGIVVGYFTHTNLLIKGILLSFSAGTFVYVSCSVVIVEEFAITRYRYSKYFCFLLGGLATVGISLAKPISQ